MSVLLLILIILAVLAIMGGGWGYSRPGWGYASFSPLGLIILLIIVFALLGLL
jgi:hypothetical protein